MLKPIDIVDENNELTGQISDAEEANNLGLWHRGVHVILYTADKHVLMQKRSAGMVMYPGMVELGIGGYVDSGETPEQAAVREVFEEAGLVIVEGRLQPAGLKRYNSRWKYKGRAKLSRTVLYTYLYQLDSVPSAFVPQVGEVEWIKLVTLRSAQWLIHHRFIKRLGFVLPLYGYYRWAIRQVIEVQPD